MNCITIRPILSNYPPQIPSIPTNCLSDPPLPSRKPLYNSPSTASPAATPAPVIAIFVTAGAAAPVLTALLAAFAAELALLLATLKAEAPLEVTLDKSDAIEDARLDGIAVDASERRDEATEVAWPTMEEITPEPRADVTWPTREVRSETRPWGSGVADANAARARKG